jgi:hypothetical protein
MSDVAELDPLFDRLSRRTKTKTSLKTDISAPPMVSPQSMRCFQHCPDIGCISQCTLNGGHVGNHMCVNGHRWFG